MFSYPFNVCGVCNGSLSFISNIGYLCLFSFFANLVGGFSIFKTFSNN